VRLFGSQQYPLIILIGCLLIGGCQSSADLPAAPPGENGVPPQAEIAGETVDSFETTQTPLKESPTEIPTLPLPTSTELPTMTPTASATVVIPSSTPFPAGGDVKISPIDGMAMRYVPAGEFIMGVDDGEIDEGPQHTVYLDAFWIDEFEVSVGQYHQCVEAGACISPSQTNSTYRAEYYNHPDGEFDNFPVIYVTWDKAQTYCEWAGRRMPVEAEWEKAARGTDGRTYPWGEDPPAAHLLNYYNVTGDDGYPEDTAPVGSYPDGASIYGAQDLIGNVWEFTADWYDAGYYAVSPDKNPDGPTTGIYRVIRGGAWADTYLWVKVHNRGGAKLDTTKNVIGFRCAADASSD
jgi:formylglycine-generating enzyme required for sulfatase activity